MGHTVTQLIEALRYKSEGRGVVSRWCHWNSSYNPSGRTMAFGNEYQEYFLGVKAAGALG